MRTYRYNPADHSITVHRKDHNKGEVIAYGPHVTSPDWIYGVAHVILRDALDRRDCARYWRLFALDKIMDKSPHSHWEITMGNEREAGEIDIWLASQRQQQTAA